MADRRALIGGLAGLAVCSAAEAAAKPDKKEEEGVVFPTTPLFASGPMAKNLIAAKFVKPERGLVWPACRLLGPKGSTRIEAYRGKLLLVMLWAEWCGPCITELPAVAYHAARSNNDKFEIVPILTDSNVFSRPSEAQSFLTKIGAKGLPTLVDASSDGDALSSALSRDPRKGGAKGSGGLPCSLILDAAGEIRGKYIGAHIEKLADGKEWNLWATNIGEEFVAALAKGDLALT